MRSPGEARERVPARSQGDPIDHHEPLSVDDDLRSCLATIQAPIIMMSQSRQETKDRMRSRHDDLVNLEAELHIRHLHEKVDHLLSRQWQRLIEIQEVKFDLLVELAGHR